MDYGAIGEFHALPAIVTVHGIVAANKCRDFSDSQLAHFLLQLADVVAAAVRRRVAPIHEAVHKNFFDFLLLGHFQQRKQMLDVRMHAAIAEQADEVQLAGAAAFHCLLKERYVLQLFAGDQQINPRDVHVHDAPRAHVHVTDFTVAHLAVGQTDEWA